MRARKNATVESSSVDLVSHGAALLGIASGAEEVAEELARLLRRLMAGSAASVVVAFVDSESGSVVVRRSAGVDIERAYPLIDELLRNARPDVRTGRRGGLSRPEPGSAADLNMFGVGSWLIAGSELADSIRCSIWIGLRLGSQLPAWCSWSSIEGAASFGAAAGGAALKLQRERRSTAHVHGHLLGISHDLRTPGVTALYAVRELLAERRGALSMQQQASLAVVEECIQEQLQYLGELLGSRQLDPDASRGRVSISLLTELGSVIQRVRFDACERGLDFEVEIATEIFAYCEAPDLRRIVSNLLDNALKYTDSGFIALRAEVYAGWVVVSVVDSGIGVPEAELANLFQRHRRLSNAAGRDGTGIGLSLARELAEMNGGGLSYHSPGGIGSAFVLTLRADEDAATRPRYNDVLLVDDDDATLRHYQRMLSPFVSRFRTASSVAAASTEIEKRLPDGLITDLHLNDGMADRLIESFTRLQPNAPVVIVSGRSASSRRPAATASVIFLEKPVCRAALIESLIGRTAFKGAASAFL